MEQEYQKLGKLIASDYTLTHSFLKFHGHKYKPR
jgi:hypothetical protein